ncbi:FecR domain-containing protein [Prolixibacteraceae bacterium Z1-6]|uniref:FecR domain-containing protein n=1 Tax=Draconibacterium aestuarii TaxID=2998507 RepID=A0A9X3J4X3_9BACT|nr:FecR domain-containing protein [Prolixibacteraceae bacterium Z1-6]
MNDKNLHTNNLKGNDDQFFAKGKIVWEKSEADVWADLEKKITVQPEGKSIKLRSRVAKWVAAAVILLLVGLFGVVTSYTKTFNCLPGQHLVVELPDGSKVDLNAGSALKYYPLRWRFERKLKFEGEGYFNVQKGSVFTVESPWGSTQVLGTTFNIYARDEQYRVTCITGSVRVKSYTDETVVLTPNVHVELEDGKLVVKKMFKAEKALSWKNNQFFFENRPLIEVIDEIERQYAVTIRLQPELNNRNFGSNFSKKYNVEEVLDFVCKPMKLKFVKQSENVYLVVEES